jgi:hypothetical protein
MSKITSIKRYWFAKDTLKFMSDPTEPTLHPHLFEPLVKESDYNQIVKERDHYLDCLIGVKALFGKQPGVIVAIDDAVTKGSELE